MQKALNKAASVLSNITIIAAEIAPERMSMVVMSGVHCFLVKVAQEDVNRGFALFLLVWGAEYWIQRWNMGDQQYLRAFAKVLEQA